MKEKQKILKWPKLEAGSMAYFVRLGLVRARLARKNWASFHLYGNLKTRKSFQSRCFFEFYFGGISPFRKLERIALGRKVGISSSGGFPSGQK